MLVPVGLSTVTAETERATVGSFSGDLVNGLLLLRISTLSPADMQSLAYGVVSFIDDDTGVRVLGDARYYPKPEPSVVALGYGDRQSVSGVVVFEPRAYNLRWLQRTGSGSLWQLAVEAETPAGVSVPFFTPSAFADGAIELNATAVVGGDGNTYGQVNWYE
jgi:hypothetical protein